MFATDPFVNSLGPRVVPQRGPSTFDEDRSCQWIATLGDASVAIRFAGLILTWNEPEVRRDLATVFKAVRVVETRDEDFSGPWSDSGDRLDSLDAFVILADRFELFNDTTDLLGQRIEDGQFDVEFSFPKFVRSTVSHGFAKRVDVLTSGVPGFLARGDLDPVVDEPGTDGVFCFVDSAVESLAVFDERSKLAVIQRGRVDAFELTHGGHASELECIVAVGFSLDVGPPPGFFVGTADECFVSVSFRQIVDPSRGSAGLQDDEVGFGIFENAVDVFSLGGGGDELGFSCF